MGPPSAVDEVLLISKPLDPPWDDGSKVLARELTRHATRFEFRTIAGVERAWKAVAAALLLSARNVGVAHFFFAPNPKTNQILKTMLKLRKRRVIHTVCSRPSGDVTVWFADVHVALTEATARLLRAAGAPDVRVIPPGISPAAGAMDRAEARAALELPDGPLVLFAGDLIDGGGARVVAEAVLQLDRVQAVFACRPKGAGREQRRAQLAAMLGDRALWLGFVADMDALYAACDVQCLPATELLAKVDLPLVLLEGLRAGLPAIIADAAPLNELESSGVRLVPPGSPAALAEAVAASLTSAGAASLDGRYDARRMAAAYEDLYAELLS